MLSYTEPINFTEFSSQLLSPETYFVHYALVWICILHQFVLDNRQLEILVSKTQIVIEEYINHTQPCN